MVQKDHSHGICSKNNQNSGAFNSTCTEICFKVDGVQSQGCRKGEAASSSPAAPSKPECYIRTLHRPFSHY